MLHTDTRGRLLTPCPKCGTLHPVRLTQKHIGTEKIRFRCPKCGTGWYAQADDVKVINETAARTGKAGPKNKTTRNTDADKDHEKRGQSLASVFFGGGKK